MTLNEPKYCNWEFLECLRPHQKWVLKRDCDEKETTITRGSGIKWARYAMSLEPTFVGTEPKGICPTCRKFVNGVNPYDNGETWRK